MNDKAALLADLGAKDFVTQIVKDQVVETAHGITHHSAVVREIDANQEVMVVRSVHFYTDETGKAFYKDVLPSAVITSAAATLKG